jgi:hypothetical protein
MEEFEKNEMENNEVESENNGDNGALMFGLGVTIGALGYRFIVQPVAKKAKIAINKVKHKKAVKQEDDYFDDDEEVEDEPKSESEEE